MFEQVLANVGIAVGDPFDDDGIADVVLCQWRVRPLVGDDQICVRDRITVGIGSRITKEVSESYGQFVTEMVLEAVRLLMDVGPGNAKALCQEGLEGTV